MLDRVDNSRAFLGSLVSLLKPGGRLVVALPLPYCAKLWTEGGQSDSRTAWAAANALPESPGENWEESACLVAAALGEAGLVVERVVRAPYLCQGWEDKNEETLYCLDDAVFVCTVKR